MCAFGCIRLGGGFFTSYVHCVRHRYISRPAVDIFLWLGMVEPSLFFSLFLFFFSFLSWCSTKSKYLRPLVPESDIVAGNTNEGGGGVQDYGTAEWMDYLRYLSEISSRAIWDGMGY